MEGHFAFEFLFLNTIIHIANLFLSEGLLEVRKLHTLLHESLSRVFQHYGHVWVVEVGVEIHKNDRKMPNCVRLPTLDFLVVLILFKIDFFKNSNYSCDLLALFGQATLIQN